MQSENSYRFVTNLDNWGAVCSSIALKTLDITDFVFRKDAKDAWGNPLPKFFALYFLPSVTEREIELFWKMELFVSSKLKEKGVTVHD